MTRSLDPEIGQLYKAHLEVLTRRYAQALEACGAERALVFAGMPRLRERDDQPYPFRADPYFIQWVPLPQAAGSVIEFQIGHRPRLIFLSEDDFWHAPTAPPPTAVFDEFEVVLATRARPADYLTQRGAKTIAIGQADMSVGTLLDSGPLISFLDYGRAVKTEYELECVRRASRIAVAGHKAVEMTLHEGVSEFELHMQYCLASQQTEDDLPYSSIVGLNEHGAMLHYQHRETTPPNELRSLLIDAGAQVNGYAADVTRTYSLHDGEFADLILAMDELQQAICNLVTADTDYVTLNERCHLLLAELLVRFGLVNCSADAAYEAEATTTFLPHGLGHLLGLQVHDVGGHSADRSGAAKSPPAKHPFLRLTRRLEPNMVLTIEPGIYFIQALLEEFEREKPGILRHETIERLMPYGGIRIEDNVQVKLHGHENLTRTAFSE
jgi:Xaa-Pro dipeptidase